MPCSRSASVEGGLVPVGRRPTARRTHGREGRAVPSELPRAGRASLCCPSVAERDDEADLSGWKTWLSSHSGSRSAGVNAVCQVCDPVRGEPHAAVDLVRMSAEVDSANGGDTERRKFASPARRWSPGRFCRQFWRISWSSHFAVLAPLRLFAPGAVKVIWAAGRRAQDLYRSEGASPAAAEVTRAASFSSLPLIHVATLGRWRRHQLPDRSSQLGSAA
eukprot:708405-Hanusia_phi.AAC.2